MSSLSGSLSPRKAHELSADFDLDSISWDAVQKLFTENPEAGKFAPDGVFGEDPRDGGFTIFNERRARRPHDYRSSSSSSAGTSGKAEAACPICRGETTPVLDFQELSDGFTFINTNLYPIVAPYISGTQPPSGPDTYSGQTVGAHFLQWTSSRHDTDWPELGEPDRTVVMERLACLERRLLELPGFPYPEDSRSVSIIKNVGRSVGGSLSHGHQQIALTSLSPRRALENRRFREEHGESYGSFITRRNPAELTVLDLERGRLIVPYYMRRPYDMQFILYNTRPGQLWQLEKEDLRDLGTALAEGMKAIRSVLLSLDREIAYNVLFHTGPGGGIYLEFLPWTQENGGYEQLGLSACQGSPFEAARILRKTL